MNLQAQKVAAIVQPAHASSQRRRLVQRQRRRAPPVARDAFGDSGRLGVGLRRAAGDLLPRDHDLVGGEDSLHRLAIDPRIAGAQHGVTCEHVIQRLAQDVEPDRPVQRVGEQAEVVGPAGVQPLGEEKALLGM